MKRFLFFLSIMMLVNIMLFAQQDTLLTFQFKVANDSSQTFGNTFNIDNIISREPSYNQLFTYPVGLGGAGDYHLSSNNWVNGADSAKGYYISFSTIGYGNIYISSRMKSSNTGPRYFKFQYKVGATGIWADVFADTIKVSYISWATGGVYYKVLPADCNNKPLVFLRWVMISNLSATDGTIDIAGTCGIDNIFITSKFLEGSALLDINRIKARINTGGINFIDTTYSDPSFEYPIDSGTHTIFCSALWIGAKQNGELHLAGERYHQYGRDYYPGPVMDSVLAESEMINWNKVWKINKSDIDYHIANWSNTGYVMPTSISQWPVESNPAIGANYWMAPFVDVDGDNSYNPANGDYPDIRGDQALYYIFNDSVYPHSETKGKRLGVEVHAMAYAYNTDPLLEKTVFMNYLIYNRSNRVYDSLYITMFTDTDIGYPKDDYVGCDTALQTYFGYNGDNFDETAEGAKGYGNNPPCQAITFLNQTMSNFKSFNNTPGGLEAITDPQIASEYYNVMHNIFCIDTAQNYWGWQPPDTTYCTSFLYSGYPSDSTAFSETGLANVPYDRRGMGTTGPYTLSLGQYISLDIAYITVDSGAAKSGGFPNIDNMFQVVPLIRDYFNSHHPQDGHDLALGIDEQQKNNPASTPQFSVYPNPTTDKLTFTTNLTNTTLTLDILDINGRLLQTSLCNGSRKVLDVSNYKKGVYIIKVRSAEQSSFVKFIKL